MSSWYRGLDSGQRFSFWLTVAFAVFCGVFIALDQAGCIPEKECVEWKTEWTLTSRIEHGALRTRPEKLTKCVREVWK